MAGTTKGMLPGKTQEKSLLARLSALYSGDTAFRGMTDFVAIGALALMFLAPPGSVQWPWKGGTGGGGTMGGAPDGGNLIQGSGSGGKGSPASPVGLPMAITFPQTVANPTLAGSPMEIDSRAFATSSAADQPRLIAALVAYAGNSGERIQEILREADGNDRNVAFMRALGLLWRNTPTDNATGLLQMRAAMDKGHAQARAMVGRLLLVKRDGITANTADGTKLIEAAAAASDSQGMRLAAVGLLSGEFGRVDAARAFSLAKKAAEAGDRMAMLLTARLAAEGIGTTANGKEAEAYLRKAAQAGYTEAQLALGHWLMNLHLKGLTTDLKEADDWLLRAYEKGHDIGANVNHAYLHSDVAKSPPLLDPNAARSLLETCAGFQLGTCQNNYGWALMSGSGGPVDNVRAHAHLTIAAELKIAQASGNLKAIDAKLSPQDKQAAAAYLAQLRKALRPVPTIIYVQYPEVALAAPVARPPVVPPAGAGASPSGTGTSGAGPSGTATVGPDYVACTNTSIPNVQRIEGCTRAIQGGTLVPAALANAYYHRGFYRWQLDENANAEKDLEEAVKLAPDNANYILYRGIARSDDGRHQLGLADIESSLKIDSKSARAEAWRGMVLSRLKQYPEAIAAAKRALDIDKTWAHAYEVTTQVHIVRQEWRDAIREATVGLGVSPDNQLLLRRSGDAYVELKEWQLAIAAYDQFIRLNRRVADVFNQRGRAHHAHRASGRDSAMADFSEAIKLDGKVASYFGNRALVTADRGETDRAIADLDKAVELEPKNPGWLNRRALQYMRKKDNVGAIADLTKALEIDADSTVAAEYYTNRARAGLADLRATKERCDALRASANERASRDIHGGAGGLMCSRAPDYESLMKDLNAAIRKNPTLSEPHYQAGVVLQEAGHYDRAFQAYEASHRLDAGNGNAVLNMGVLLYKFMNRREAALERFNEAIRINASNPGAHAWRGTYYASLGARGRDEAIRSFNRVLEIPDNEHIDFARKEIDRLRRL